MREFTSEMASGGQYGICAKCKKFPTKEGHDGCLGTLCGLIRNVCCGHGNVNLTYVQYFGGKIIVGEEAVAEQKRLMLNWHPVKD